MRNSIQILKRLESFQTLFLILTVLNAVPILMFNCYPSLDGPAHLYNVNVLKQLLIQKNQFLSQYFTLNREVIPNWTSHFILLVFRLILSSATANKLLLLIIAFSLPITVYSLINRIAPRNIMLSVFALPFVYTYLFGLGFYNFCIGVILFFITLNYWLRPGNRISIIRILGLFGLLTLSYFTHILIFLVTFLSVGLFSLLNLLGELRERKTGPETFKELFFVLKRGCQ